MPWMIPAAIAVSGAMSAGSQMAASGKASSASKQAAAQQQQMFDTVRASLAPYYTTGQSVLGPLASVATSGPTGGGPDYVSQASGLAPGPMTEADLVKTPGYQFTLDQGLKAVQSNAAARGIGVSGSALKGAATYATGLADKTYQDQFALQQARFQNALALNTAQQGNLQAQFGRLSDVAKMGAGAAAGAGQIGENLTGAGYTALAGQQAGAGGVNATNALSQGLQSYLGYNQLQQLMNPNSGYTPANGFYPAGTAPTPIYQPTINPTATYQGATSSGYGNPQGYNPVVQGGY